MPNNQWYKEKPENKIWWLDNGNDVTGEFVFSFDKVEQFNLFADYPQKLTKEQKAIFDEENPEWMVFFIDRQ